MQNPKKLAIIQLLLFALVPYAFANTYELTNNDEDVVGKVQYIKPSFGESIANINKKYNIGFNELQEANPAISAKRNYPPMATTLKIPGAFILPPADSRQGIVVNLTEMRLYYFPKNSTKVMTYPIGIGKLGKMIPVTKTAITRKKIDPTWYPPEDIREFNLKVNGIVLPKVMPPGPDNPLGHYAIYLGIPTYLIHSTIFPESIGRRASFGCIRMFESDIEQFFPMVSRAIPVLITTDSVKVGWAKNKLMLEAHEPLDDYRASNPDSTLSGVVQIIDRNVHKKPTTIVDWQMVSYLTNNRDGLPHEIGTQIA
jgi:L,D-transpeptidase ErfK/SrfK